MLKLPNPNHRPARILPTRILVFGIAAALSPWNLSAQQTSTPTSTKPATAIVTPQNQDRASKLFLEGGRELARQNYKAAIDLYSKAAKLDPTNPDYQRAEQTTRSYAANSLLSAAASAHTRNDEARRAALLSQAAEVDPQGAEAAHRLALLKAESLSPAALGPMPDFQSAAALAPTGGRHDFHLRMDPRALIPEVMKAYGITATVDDAVRSGMVRFDVENATYPEAKRALQLTTQTLFVSVDPRHVMAVQDNRDNLAKYEQLELATIYVPGLVGTDLTDLANMGKNLFLLQTVDPNQANSSLTVRAPASELHAYEETIRELETGRGQMMLDVRLIELSRTNGRNTGITPPQQFGIFNVAAEAQSILNANQAAVQQIISSGLAAPGDTFAILAILIASGQVQNSILSNGFATFGGTLNGCGTNLTSCTGALTTFGLSPGPATLNLTVNSSNSKLLDAMELRLGDGEAGTLKLGTRYPIQTSSFSSLSGSAAGIAGLSAAGNSGNLSSLLSSLTSAVPNVPQVNYEDLGLTLKATPKILRNGNVALSIEMKVTALTGQQINSNPVLASRDYEGVVTLKEGEAIAVVSDLDKEQSLAVGGIAGLSEIPGLNNITDKDTSRTNSTLLIVMTPHLTRETSAAMNLPLLHIEKSTHSR